MSNSSLDKIRALAAEHFNANIAGLSAETSFVEDLKADSLDVVEVVMMLEESFGIGIPDEDAEKITTIGAAAAYVDKVKG